MVVELPPDVARYIKDTFSKLINPVTLYVFTTKNHCLYCNETLEIARIIAEFSHLIKIEECECTTDSQTAKEFNIDKHPAIVVHGREKYGIRFFGVPSGYELGSLVEAIVDASRGETEIPPDVKELVRSIDKKVNIQVFVTPTCPYCPIAVRAAHKFAILNRNILGDMIEAIEFPDLSQKYMVMAVPKIVINEKVTFEGAVPEMFFAQKIIEAIE